MNQSVLLGASGPTTRHVGPDDANLGDRGLSKGHRQRRAGDQGGDDEQ